MPEEGRPPVPPALQVTAAWVWRLLLLAAGVWLVATLLTKLLLLVVPVAVAVVATALLKPAADWLARHG